MSHIKQFFIAGIALLTALASALPVGAKPKKLTDTISWEVSNDTLRVYGHGDMPDFDFAKPKAWLDKKIWPAVKVIEISEGITAIGKYNFVREAGYDKNKNLPNDNIVELYLPLSLKQIGMYSFQFLNIKNLILPSRLKWIDYGAFCAYEQLSDEDWGTLIIPATIINIGYEAFLNRNIQHLVFADATDAGVSEIEGKPFFEIGMRAFATNIPHPDEEWGSLIIPPDITKIGQQAFKDRNIRDLTILGAADVAISAITTIPTLESVDFNNQPSDIGWLYAYDEPNKYNYPQDSLKSVKNWKKVIDLPSGFRDRGVDKRPAADVAVDGFMYRINYREEYATFIGIEGETLDEYLANRGYGGILITDEITYQGETFPVTGFTPGMFTGNLLLRDITLPDAMKVIPANAFRGCENLKHVDLPRYLVRVGDFAFEKCKALEYVTFPETTRVIGNAAFDGCLSLESVILPDGLKKIGDHCFDVCPKLSHITVPDGVELGHDWYRSAQ